VIGSVWREGCASLVNLSPQSAGFCILHCKLRIIGDALVSKLAQLAQAHRCTKTFVNYMQKHIAENFKIDVVTKVAANGDKSQKLECSSLIGNKCDQFVGTDHYPNLCEAAGIKNFHNAIGDNNDGQ
jgi:hypothetical protein